MSIGKRLSELRGAKDWTLDELAEASAVSAPYLSKLERDKALPQRDTLIAVVDALDPDPHDATDVLRERDQAELIRLGYTPEAAQLVVALEKLDPETRSSVIERYATELAALHLAADPGEQLSNVVDDMA